MLQQSDFFEIRKGEASLQKSVLSDAGMINTYDWLAPYQNVVGFKLNAAKIAQIQAALFDDEIDWSPIQDLPVLAKTKNLSAIWIETQNTGWLCWPVSSVYDGLGSARKSLEIFIGQFGYNKGQVVGLPFVGHIEIAKISQIKNQQEKIRRDTIRAAIQFAVPKLQAKLLLAQAIEDGGAASDIQRIVQKSAAENVGSFITGLLVSASLLSISAEL